jgi:hypothetical protein
LILALLLAGGTLRRRRELGNALAFLRPRSPAFLLVVWGAAQLLFLAVTRVTPTTRLAAPVAVAFLPLVVDVLVRATRAREAHLRPAVLAAIALALVRLAPEAARPVTTLEDRIEASPRLSWVRERAEPGDFLIGNDIVDVPFQFGPRPVFSFSPHPFTEPLTEARLLGLADARASAGGRILVLIERRAGEGPWGDSYGEFVATLVSAEGPRHPRIERLEHTESLTVCRVAPAPVPPRNR